MISHESAVGTCTRRTLLGAVGASLTAALLGDEPRPPRPPVDPNSIYSYELGLMMEEFAPYAGTDPTERPVPRHDQLAVASNPRLAQDIGATASHAFVVVHPGYLIEATVLENEQLRGLRKSYESTVPSDSWQSSLTEDERQQFDRAGIAEFTTLLKGAEGDYGPYLSRLERLFAFLGRTSAPVIVYEEAKNAYSGVQLHPKLATPHDAFIVATAPDDPSPITRVGYTNERGRTTYEHQDPQLLYKWLRRNCINTVYIAGEYGVSPGGGEWPACVGTVAEKLLANRFAVRGIKDTIFPTRPTDVDAPDNTPESDAMYRALYVDTVSLPR